MHRLPHLLGVISKHDLFFHQSYLLLFETLFHPSIFVQVPPLLIPSAPLRSPLRLLPYSVHNQRCTLDIDTLFCPFLFLHAHLFLTYSADSEPVDLLAPGFS